MKIHKIIVIPIAGAMLSASLVSGQEQRPDEKDQQNQNTKQNADQKPGQGGHHEGGDRSAWQKPDHAMAAVVAIDNQEEIALSKFAQDKIQHEDVKKFATMMVEEHQTFVRNLEQHAPGVSSLQLQQAHGDSPDGQRDQPGQTQQGKQNRSQVEQARATANEEAPGVRQTAGVREDQSDDQAGMDMVQFHQEIAQECLRGAMVDLEGKQGADFDKAFIGCQIAKHGAMKAKLTVFQRHASGDLAQVFGKAAETAERHKEQAEQIMAKLEDSSNTPSQARTDRREERREEKRENK